MKKRANIVKKVLKIPNKKSTHTGPTNSTGKSFSYRNEFTLVAVSKGLVAQSVKSQFTGTNSTWLVVLWPSGRANAKQSREPGFETVSCALKSFILG